MDETKFEYPADVRRIAIVSLFHGHEITYKEAEAVWKAYSDIMAASWIHLPESDDDIWNCISWHFIKKADEQIVVQKKIAEWRTISILNALKAANLDEPCIIDNTVPELGIEFKYDEGRIKLIAKDDDEFYVVSNGPTLAGHESLSDAIETLKELLCQK